LLSRRRRFDDEVRKEIAFHVDMESTRRQHGGASEAEARASTLRDFGGVLQTREQVNDARGMTFWDSLGQDLRFGLRTLRRTPGYTLAAILILALGIGANSAMFSVINGVLLEPLPFRDGDDLVLLRQSASQSNVANAGVSIQELGDYRTRLTTVRDLVEFHQMSFVLLNQGEPDRVDTGVVSSNFFDMLGVRPSVGRSFNDTDDDIGSEAVLILSHAYWQSKFGGDTNVIGRVLQMNNRPHTVIGVLPDYPQYPRAMDVYMPTSACPFRAAQEVRPALGHRSFAGLQVFGRLAPGATLAQASAEIDPVARSFERDFASDHQRTRSVGFGGEALSLREQLVTGARTTLYVLIGVTTLVLVLACANVANLSLARTLRRGREMAVRTALGAGRRRLVRQLITESLIVATAGGLLGLFVAWLSVDLLSTFVGRYTSRTGQIDIDAGVVLYTVAASLLAGVVFGLAPALSTRADLAHAMREGGAQGGEAGGRHRIRSALVVGQVTVSFVLVVGAALLLQSFYRMVTVPLGFRTDQVMTAAIFGNFSRQNVGQIETDILQRLRTSPGIRFAALTTSVPQSAISPGANPITIDGEDQTRPLQADLNFASDQYFDALGVPLLAGRDFRPSDTPQSQQVAIINASMAKFWEGADPIGRTFSYTLFNGQQAQMTVVGVVADFRLYSVDIEVPAQFYRPVSQSPGNGTRLLVQAEGDPRALAPTIKDAVHAVSPTTPVEELATLEEVRGVNQLASRQLTAMLLGLFAVIALVVTLAGLAGVIGTTVSQRTREFGLRMALGASRWSVLSAVLNQGLLMVAVGIVLGIGGAIAFSQLIATFLFHTTPTDVGAYAAVAGLFLLAAAIAAAGPARRATMIDPLKALRSE
jgi:predicted permease